MEKKENRPPPFSFKKASKKQVGGMLKKMKKKMSAGIDGLSQQHLVQGSDSLTESLTCITVILKCVL